MSTLDSPNNFVDQSNVPYMSTALRYGGLAGLGSVILGLLSNMLGLVDPCKGFSASSALIMVVGIGIMVAAGALAVQHHRNNELGGYITFGRAFVVAFIAIAIAAAIGGAFNLLYMYVIDPTMVDTMKDCIVQQYEEAGMSQEQIDQAMGFVGISFNPAVQAVSGIIFGPAFYGAIIGLIIGAIMKKNPPHMA